MLTGERFPVFGILILYIEVSNKHGPKQRWIHSNIILWSSVICCFYFDNKVPQPSIHVVIRPENESSGMKAEHVDFLLCRRPECHSGFSSSVCKVSVTHDRTKLQCEQTVIRFESSGSAHRGRFKSASAHTFAGSALCYSVTNAFSSVSPPQCPRRG